jgi:hypothetical protein
VDLPGKVGKSRAVRESETYSTTSEERDVKQNKIEGYFTSNLMEIFKEKIRSTEQANLDKRT